MYNSHIQLNYKYHFRSIISVPVQQTVPSKLTRFSWLPRLRFPRYRGEWLPSYHEFARLSWAMATLSSHGYHGCPEYSWLPRLPWDPMVTPISHGTMVTKATLSCHGYPALVTVPTDNLPAYFLITSSSPSPGISRKYRQYT